MPTFRTNDNLTFVVGGGGPTGVEYTGALVELLYHPLASDYPELDLQRQARVALLEAAYGLLRGVGGGDYARQRLEAMGVEVRLASAVAAVTEEAVVLAGGESIATASPVWTAGVRGATLAGGLPWPRARGGRIPVRRRSSGATAGPACASSRPMLRPTACTSWPGRSTATSPCPAAPGRPSSSTCAAGGPLLRVTLGGSTETSRARDAVIAQRLAALVQASPAAVTLENHWGVSTDIERHLEIFDAVAAALPAGLRPRWWRELARRANHFHLKGTAFDAAGDETHLPHAAIFDLLAGAGYRGAVTIEYAGDGDALDGLRQSVRLW